MLRCSREQRLSVGQYRYLFFPLLAAVTGKLVCHPALNPVYEVSAFGIETQLRLFLFGHVLVGKESIAAVEHVAESPVAFVYLVEDREHTAEEDFLSPIEHITCIGTYLIISRKV